MPTILKSAAFHNGIVFIIWEESEGEGGDFPIGVIVLSPFAKGGGYFNTIHYTHSATIQTLQKIFGVTPFLGDAANGPDLSDRWSNSGDTPVTGNELFRHLSP